MPNATIDLRRPIGRERVRGFQPPWRTVFLYTCPSCGATVRVAASAFRGSSPEPATGAIACPSCSTTTEA